MKRQADRKALELLFEMLGTKLGGMNFTLEDDGTGFFDFNYDQYCFTFKLDEEGISLADNVDIYNEYEQYVGNYSLKETFFEGIDDGDEE